MEVLTKRYDVENCKECYFKQKFSIERLMNGSSVEGIEWRKRKQWKFEDM